MKKATIMFFVGLTMILSLLIVGPFLSNVIPDNGYSEAILACYFIVASGLIAGAFANSFLP